MPAAPAGVEVAPELAAPRVPTFDSPAAPPVEAAVPDASPAAAPEVVPPPPVEPIPPAVEPAAPVASPAAPPVDFTSGPPGADDARVAAQDLTAVEDAPTELDRARLVVDLYLGELAKKPPQRRAGRLHYECARLLESPLGDMATAAEHFRKAHQLIPDLLPAIQGARRASVASGNNAAALPLFDAEVALTAQPGGKAWLLHEKGRLLDEELGNRKQAQAAFMSACELEKGDATLLKAAALAEFKVGAWEELDRVYAGLANSVKADLRHRAAVTGERARLVEVHRTDSQLATELYQSAFELDPRASGALHALKYLHYGHARWHDLVKVLEREAELATQPAVKALAYYRAGRVYVDRLGDLDAGISAIERAAAEAPDDPLVLEELARLYEQARQYPGLAGVLQRLAQQATSLSAQVSYLHRIGEICERRMGDEETAVRWYEQVVRLAPDHQPTLEALTKLYTRRKQWAPLATMLLNDADASSNTQLRAAAHARIAEIQEKELGNLEEAVEHHGRALGLQPGYPPSFKALERLHAKAGRYRELIELWERAVDEATEPATRITYLFKIGRAYEDSLAEPGQARHAYQRILAVEAGHLEAIHAWQRAAERAQEWTELVEALRQEAEQTHDAKRAAGLLHRAGEVLDIHLNEPEAAVEQHAKVAKRLPNYQPSLRSLSELYHRLGRWEDLLQNHKSELRGKPRGPALAPLLFAMGELCEEHLARDEDALGFYREATDLDPAHEPSLRALERKLRERGLWSDLVQLLEKELGALEQPERRARAANRIGEVYESRLNDPIRALAAFERALQADPSFRPAIDGHTRLLEQAKKWGKLADALAEEAEAATDPTLAITALFREAEIRRDQLDQRDRAVAGFAAVLERDPEHLGALLALEPLYAAGSDWEGLASNLATQARVLTDVGAKVAVLHQVARLQEQHGLVSIDDIKQTYFNILQLLPSDLPALLGLERLSLIHRDRQLLGQVDARLGGLLEEPSLSAAHSTRLGEILESAGDASALKAYRAALTRDAENFAAARGMSRMAQRAGDPALLDEAATWESRVSGDQTVSAKLLVKAASVRVQRGEDDTAMQLLERALTFDPDLATTAERLRELATGRGEVDRLLAALTKAAQAAKQPARQAELWIAVAELQAEEKHDLPAGLAALKRVVFMQPGNVTALFKQADFYCRDAQWQNAAECLDEIIKASPPAEIKVDASLRLASILGEHLGNQDRARGMFESVLGVEENHAAALEGLLHLQLVQGQHDAAAETAARLIDVTAEPQARAHALGQLAKVERARNKITAAVEACEQAVALVGLHGEAATQLKDLLPALKGRGDLTGWKRYATALSNYLDTSTDAPAVLAESYLEAARIHANQLRHSDKAVSLLRRGLELDPKSIDMRLELVARLKDTSNWTEALRQLRTLLEVDVSRPQTWRDLSETLAGMNRIPESQVAMAPLVAIGAANDLERATLAARPSRYAVVQAGAFHAAEIETIDAAGGRSDAAAILLGAVAEGLGKLTPPDLSRYGLSARDRIGARSGHALRTVADQVGAAFGLGEFHLYVQSVHSGSPNLELTDPVSLIVPAYLSNLTEPQQVFLLGRACALVARRVHPVEVLAPQEIDLALAAATRYVVPDFGMRRSDDAYLNDYGKRLYKALSRRGRRAMEDAAPAYSRAPLTDVAAWTSKVRLTAARAALILADDLPGSIGLVRQLEGDLSGAQGDALAHGIKQMNDLVRFWVSEPAFDLRRRLGIL